ncbi:unnamed protein product (macronuclear) [Paramecium tetraurelia]|uniref:Calcium-transporting ATPase n=1 Tax=Paramecium tetraurelia TaxID=5888 RepID=A0DKE2_PARTE|nr:uncharacterized protein GSPATT00017838001 [Paramecium tetraurelia]CAK83509.1 unnamed protein product [Paramecium tetraurelia]|eukprot:XP_001450906.1 hypothetical protein (macronuclear) [Paramecium tetraurelia strain d4-2]
MQQQYSKQENSRDFEEFHNIEELKELFLLNSINDGSSFQKVLKLGGDQGLAKQLKSHLLKGIDSEAQVQENREKFGNNDPIEKEPAQLCELILECFGDTMLQILLAAALVSTIIGIINEGVKTGWTEGATIFLAVFLIVSITAGNNYLKERQFQQLRRKLDDGMVQVVRGGIVEISIKEIVVGDILQFGIGDIFQVDGLMIQGSQIKVDESPMTGESDEIKKLPFNEMTQSQSNSKDHHHYSPFLISGTRCLDGNGYMLVLQVGQNTIQGQLKLLLNQDNPPTPLQQKLEGVAENIGKLGTLVAILTFIALMGHLIYDVFVDHKHELLTLLSLQLIIEAFMIGVTIIVVAVPEGLPLAVTIALAYSVGKMKDEQNLVKNLASCEIMGGANNICSDKTGTLTQNIMQVTALWIENHTYMNQEINVTSKISRQSIEIMSESICYNSIANPTKDRDTNRWTQIGNKTECALIELADNFGFKYSNYRLNERILRQIPFSSKRKKMVTAILNPKNQAIRIFCKGASEIILAQCFRYVSTNGVEQVLDKVKKDEILHNIIENFASHSLRTIAIAYKDLEPQTHVHQINEDDIDKDLTLIAIAGIKDPIRPDVADSIRQCTKSGVTVRMVTGDNLITAQSIALECGILEKNRAQQEFEVIEGKKFRDLVGGLVSAKNEEGKEIKVVKNMQIFSKISREMKVMARASPEDKYLLVTGLIQEGNVVAVTGDGTNDAPALKKADVGFAMGITGSDVAKDAADIILIDDNFSSIITAMKWGRNIYDCIRKFIQFQLTVNLVALFMSFTGAVILKQSPLNAIEMLWVNLIMDTFASLALATEPPSIKVLDRQPYRRSDQIVSPTMYRTIVGASLYQIIVLTFILFLLPKFIDCSIPEELIDQKNVVQMSIFFQAFVLMQVFNSISCRQLDYHTRNPFANFCNNPLFWIVQIITVIVQVLLIQYGGKYVKVSHLTLEQHLLCVGLAVGGIIFSVLFKFIPEGLCQKIHLFREEEIKTEKMDYTLTSKLRRKSTMRLHTSQRSKHDFGSLNKMSSDKI